MKVYLCGPINGCTDEESRNWREAAKAILPDTLDPMRRDYRGLEDHHVAQIVEGDKADIDECDALLVNYNKPSVGTSMEILYAWEKKKKIIAVARPETRISPWLRYHSTHIVNSFDAAFELLK
jgi:nucleoside 2-deoxyribosyltransferase